MSFTEQLHRCIRPVYLVHGTDAGTPVWYFIETDSAREKALKLAMQKGIHADVATFGRIVASGYGEAPPERMITMLKEKGLINP